MYKHAPHLPSNCMHQPMQPHHAYRFPFSHCEHLTHANGLIPLKLMHVMVRLHACMGSCACLAGYHSVAMQMSCQQHTAWKLWYRYPHGCDVLIINFLHVCPGHTTVPLTLQCVSSSSTTWIVPLFKEPMYLNINRYHNVDMQRPISYDAQPNCLHHTPKF